MNNLLFCRIFLFCMWWRSDRPISQAWMSARSLLLFLADDILASLDVVLKLMIDGKLWKIRVLRLIVDREIIKIAWVRQCLCTRCSGYCLEIEDSLHSIILKMSHSLDELHVLNYISLERSPSLRDLALIGLRNLLIDLYSKWLKPKALIGLAMRAVKMLLIFLYLSRLRLYAGIEGISLCGNVQD